MADATVSSPEPADSHPSLSYPVDPWVELAKIEDENAKHIEQLLERPALCRKLQGDLRIALVATRDLASRYRQFALSET